MTTHSPTTTTSASASASASSEARTAFLASLKSVGSNLDTDLRARATTQHDNAAVLHKQEAELAKTTRQVGKQANELEKLADQGRQGLKEVGDLQNWAEMMERDLLVVEEAVRLAEEEEDGKRGRVGEEEEGRERTSGKMVV
ncbi:hypothetical protein PRK78_002735 [Emydomyces testavorans]|uniref:Biogenesis of lysosome-related organelles complex 1 subunit 1 n=1 Tax=Emydomyces testavorans TaxID=2070801 RepID=A0AAF0DEV5_9EURO|nr:hypothetical protein PRK78_002735 [Emydomyces testavorans]